MSAFTLTEKTVLLTGAGGFLGHYFAHALAEAGAQLVLAGLQEEQTAQRALLTELEGAHATQGLSLTVDVTDAESIQQAVSVATSTFSSIDVLVNSAAIDPKFDNTVDPNATLFENYPEALLKQSVDVNLLGYVRVCQAAIPYMLERQQGVIVNISSMYGLVGPDQRIYPENTQKPVDYAITKGGVNMLTRWLATTYGTQGIRANTLTLCGVYRNHDKTFLEKYMPKSPMGRMLNPEEVGPPLVFLSSAASSGMTGSNLIVDTGWTAW